MILFFAFLTLKAQEQDLSILIADILETVADRATDEEDETDMENLIEYYTYLAENPLNVNSAADEELSRMFVLTEFQIFSLKEYIREFGYLMSVHELTFVPGFDEEIVSKIAPFVTAVEPEQKVKLNVKIMTTKGNSSLLARAVQRLEPARGYTDKTSGQYYTGSPFGAFMRYRYKYRENLQIGLTADKDRGEEFFKGSNKQGFDFYGFHLMLTDINHLKKFIIGDFRANFGQGLVIWNGFSMDKSANIHAIKKRNNGFSAYSSSDEVTFQRGLASTLQYGSWEFSPFISYKKIDAAMNEDNAYTSLSNNGLHRTPNEIAKKHALPETVAGINVACEKTFWRIATTFLYGRYDGTDMREIKPYNMFELHKSSNANMSIDYRWLIKNVSIFGEAAVSLNGGKAVIAGVSTDINRFAQASILYRNYQKNYQAVYADAFGENGNTANEHGLYLGLTALPHRNWKISTYFDMFSFPWLRYGINSPSSGYDFMMQINYTPNNDFDFYVRLQCDKSLKNLSIQDSTIASVQNINRAKILLNAKYILSKGLSMSSRIAFGFFDPEFQNSEKGFLMYQDVRYKLQSIPLSFSARYAIFATNSWNTRLYAYESDILYAFSVPAYYGKGCRYYLNISYKIFRNIQLWFRISQTRYFDRNETGSGLSTIKGNKLTDIKLQAQFKF
ncbi:MAG: helix-hairpin-helix domain-containing protein [Prevotellaceae bacterium]|nr:helix-hairpin-helix domain-containing protein [Prevotellaceae bacterium]